MIDILDFKTSDDIIAVAVKVAKRPSFYYFSKMNGWVGLEKVHICYVQYCIYANIVGGWVRKSPNICWRNIRMVPVVNSDDSQFKDDISGCPFPRPLRRLTCRFAVWNEFNFQITFHNFLTYTNHKELSKFCSAALSM